MWKWAMVVKLCHVVGYVAEVSQHSRADNIKTDVDKLVSSGVNYIEVSNNKI
jgi:hypothetical protein